MVTVETALLERRSIRAFKPDPVARETVERIIQLAGRAPFPGFEPLLHLLLHLGLGHGAGLARSGLPFQQPVQAALGEVLQPDLDGGPRPVCQCRQCGQAMLAAAGQSTTCSRSLSRGSPADRIAGLICASSSWLMLTFVRFLAMPLSPIPFEPYPAFLTDSYCELVLICAPNH